MTTPVNSSDYIFAFSKAVAALENGRIEEFRSILHDYVDLSSQQDCFGRTLLHLSSANPRGLEFMKSLLRAGADVNKRSSDGVTAIENAMTKSPIVEDDYFRRTETLLEAGADKNTIMSNGYTALQKAIFIGRLDIAELLLKHHADPFKLSADLPASNTWEVTGRSGNRQKAQELLARFGVRKEQF